MSFHHPVIGRMPGTPFSNGGVGGTYVGQVPQAGATAAYPTTGPGQSYASVGGVVSTLCRDLTLSCVSARKHGVVS